MPQFIIRLEPDSADQTGAVHVNVSVRPQDLDLTLDEFIGRYVVAELEALFDAWKKAHAGTE